MARHERTTKRLKEFLKKNGQEPHREFLKKINKNNTTPNNDSNDNATNSESNNK